MTARSVVRMTLAWSGLVCVLAPPARADGQFTAGSQGWSQTVAEAKFQEFREVPRGGVLENFVWREWSGRNSVALWGSNALRHDQAANLTLTNGARWRMDLGYLEIPHTFSQVARS